MGKKVILIFVFLLIVAFSEAKLTAEVVPIDSRIYPDEQAAYKLTIHNGDDIEKFIRIYTPDIRWYIDLDPDISKIGPKEDLKTNLMLIPTAWASSGTQLVRLIIESPNTKETNEYDITVSVKSFDEEPKQYPASVELKIKIPESVDPRENLPVEVYVRNRNKLNITDMRILIKSKHFSDERLLSLEPLAESREKFLFQIDPSTPPSVDTMELWVFVGDRDINNERINYDIKAYSEMKVREEMINELFKTSIDYVITNEGNVYLTDNFVEDLTLLQKPFTYMSPNPARTNIKQQSMEWDLQLAPYEQTRITVVRNYRPAIYLVLIISVIIMMYYVYRSPIVVKKEAMLIGSSKEEKTEMKVLIHVRNRTPDIVEELCLSDQIPNLAELIEENKLGVLAPSKIIKHQKKGTLIKWEFESLEPFEERILTYRMKSKISILGGFMLPRSKMKFKGKRGTERIIKSNKTIISFGL